MRYTKLLAILSFFPLGTIGFAADGPILEKRDYGIQRALVHWSGYDAPGYLDWAGEAKVQLMQVGFFGPILYCMANSAGRENWHFIPREGYQANYDYYRDFIRRAHQNGIKVNGHFSMSYLFGDRPRAGSVAGSISSSTGGMSRFWDRVRAQIHSIISSAMATGAPL